MTSQPPTARSRIRSIATAVLGVGLLGLLFNAVPDADVGAVLARTEPRLAAAALFSYLLTYACRALRFRMLLHSARPPVTDLLGVVAVHNLLNMLLPMRTGELSYVFLVKRRYSVSLAEGAATLLLARLYDVIGIALFFLVALALDRTTIHGDLRELLLGTALFLCGSLVLLVALIPGARLAVRSLRGLVGRLGWTGRPAADRVLSAGAALVDHLERIRARRTALRVLLVTQAQWFFTLLTCYLLLRAAGVDFPFSSSVLGSTGLSVALILPINTFANVGSFEAGWTVGYGLAGLAADLALATAVAAHLFILLFAALLGGLGALRLRRRPTP